MCARCRLVGGATVALLLVRFAGPAAADDATSSAPGTHDTPAKFFVNYPAAEQYCPPIRTAFADAASTFRVVRGKRIAFEPNGAYGMQVRGDRLFHTGADLGWQRDGDPVFAVADGVVRSSQRGIRSMAAEAGRRLPGGPIDYGNLIIIEHRTPDGEFFFSLYGHLGNDRLVSAGDLVTAGQQIGTIGRKAAIVNGGYEPHLHFGIREGALFAPGDRLLPLQIGEQQIDVRIIATGEDHIRMSMTPDPGTGFTATINGERVDFTRDADAYLVPAWVLYRFGTRGTSFAGYASSLEGWTDPIAFLRGKGANVHPPQAMYVTPCRDDDFRRRYILSEPAPSWTVAEWIRPDDNPGFDVGDFAGRVVALFCFDVDCRASQTHGLPALTRVASSFNGDTGVAVVGLLTPIGRGRASRTELRRLAEQLPPQVPLGRCGEPRTTPAVLDDYQICGTPWIVLIDREGIVQFSNYTVRPGEIIRRIDELKSR